MSPLASNGSASASLVPAEVVRRLYGLWTPQTTVRIVRNVRTVRGERDNVVASMERLGPGQTTLTGRSERVLRGDGHPSGISWLFPEPLVTRFQGDRVLLGRAEDCDTMLPGRETSRHHAEIRRVGPVHAVFDLASRNGVFVNGERRAEAPLSSGDVVRLGEWVGLVQPMLQSERLPVLEEIANELVGGATLAAAVDPARRASRTDLSIVIQGETGTGKECLARAIHAWSGRVGELVAVNCGALPETLAEAELFGYRQGAFTGASRSAAGLFRAAHRGTLLLDEIVELPLALQAKLLRVVEQGEVVPLGETRPVPLDVRVVVAAQRPLAQAVADGQFRADLMARLEGLTVVLPPLRDRRQDVPGLLLHLLARHSGGHPPRVEAKLVERLMLHTWPYNVRELVQLVRRLLALHGGESQLTLAQLSSVMAALPDADAAVVVPASGATARARRMRRNEAIVQRLTDALKRHAGNVSRAATAIGISRQRAYRLLSEQPGFDLEALRMPEPPEPAAGDEP